MLPDMKREYTLVGMRHFCRWLRGSSLLLLVWTMQTTVHGQELTIAEDKELIYIGGLSPFILDQGDVEASLTSSLLSYWNVFNGYRPNGEFYSNIYRLSLSDNIVNVSYGFDQDGKWDLGAEFRYTFRRFDDAARNSPFKVFSGDEPSYAGFSYLGLRFRIAPFDNIPHLTFQSSVLFPQADKSKRSALGADHYQWSIYGTYYSTLTENIGYFFQAGWGFYFPGAASNSMINAAQGAAFLSFDILANQLFLIPGLSYSGSYDGSMQSLSQGLFGMIVVQWQLGTKFSLNIQQGIPLIFESQQPGVSFERSSFSSTALGVRMMFDN